MLRFLSQTTLETFRGRRSYIFLCNLSYDFGITPPILTFTQKEKQDIPSQILHLYPENKIQRYSLKL
jgi:hypothetical protein